MILYSSHVRDWGCLDQWNSLLLLHRLNDLWLRDYYMLLVLPNKLWLCRLRHHLVSVKLSLAWLLYYRHAMLVRIKLALALLGIQLSLICVKLALPLLSVHLRSLSVHMRLLSVHLGLVRVKLALSLLLHDHVLLWLRPHHHHSVLTCPHSRLDLLLLSSAETINASTNHNTTA